MLSPNLSCRTLSELTGHDLATHLMTARDVHSQDTVTSFLLESVEQGAIPPPVLSIWFSITKDPAVIESALRSKSRYTRRYAILAIGKWLRTEEAWETIWDHLGGVKGWMELFERSSLEDVEGLIRAIRKAVTTNEGGYYKRKAFTMLFQALLPQWFPGSKYKTRDKRQLSAAYVRLLPACETLFAMEALDIIMDQSNKLAYNVTDNAFVMSHSSAVRLMVCDYIAGKQPSRKWIAKWLPQVFGQIPPLPSPRFQNWSASMQFSLDILISIQESEESQIEPSALVSQLVIPLLKRAYRRKLPLASIAKVCEHVLKHAEKNPKLANHLGHVPSQGNFSSFLLRLWSADPDNYQSLLIRALKLNKNTSETSFTQMDSLVNWLNHVASTLRYRLLRLLGIHACQKAVDIDSRPDLAQTRGQPWRPEIFLSLERESADKLLQHLIDACGSELRFKLPHSSQGLLGSGRSMESQDLDLPLLQTLLSEKTEHAMQAARQYVEEKRKVSEKCRDEGRRAFYAKAAFNYSIASRHIGLYRDTIEWSRRFIRDHYVSRKLFSNSDCYGQALDLLAGTTPDADANVIKARVQAGNEALLLFLDIACSALRTPFFQQHHWQATLDLFKHTVTIRLGAAKKLQRQMNLSDDQVYDILWEDTVSTLIQAEKTGLNAEYEKLEFNCMDGPLKGLNLERIIMTVSSCLFLDNLAKARDELWRGFRIAHCPAVTALPPPWPQGLPVQSVFPCSKQNAMPVGVCPYLQNRVEKVVLMSSEKAHAALPSEEDKTVIGIFVDSYNSALRFYVLLAPYTSRMAVLLRAWDHAISALSKELKTPMEACLRWSQIFTSALSGLSGDVTQFLDVYLPNQVRKHLAPWREWDIGIPEDADYEHINEWDPVQNMPQPSEAVTYNPVIIDCLTNALSSHVMPALTYGFRTPRGADISVVQPTDIWDKSRTARSSRTSGRILEGITASALLFLDLQKGGSTSAFSEGFPRTWSSKRFPPLLLDSEFGASARTTTVGQLDIHRAGYSSPQHRNLQLTTTKAFDILRTVQTRLPATILVSIAEGAFNALKGLTENVALARIEEVLFRSLCMVGKSDRPDLGFQLVCNAIMDLSGSSHWHRHIFHRAFLKRLSLAQATSFVESLIDRIVEIAGYRTRASKEQAQKGPDTCNSKDHEPNTPYVKVTSVKMLAQALRAPDLFPGSFGLTALNKLLLTQTHVDIRVDTLKSVFEVAEAAMTQGVDPSSTVVEQLMAMLLRFSPVIAGFSDRTSGDQSAWLADEMDQKLPEIEVNSPLFNVISMTTRASGLPESTKDMIVHKILLPSILDSITAHRKWLVRFAEKHQIDLEFTHHPIIPSRERLLSCFVELYSKSVPQWLFQLWHDRSIMLINPPIAIRKASQQVASDTKLKQSTEGQHWLSVFPEKPTYSRLTIRTNWLYADWDWTLRTDGLTLTDARQGMVDVARAIIEADDPDVLSNWQEFVWNFRWIGEYFQSRAEHRESCARPVLEQIIELVDSFRTPEWNKDPDRRPRRLPETFELRMWLMRYPREGRESQVDFDVFADQLLGALNEMIDRCIPYIKHYKQIKDTAKSVRDRVRLAAVLADLSSISTENLATTRTLLRLELAKDLLLEGNEPPSQQTDKDKLRACVEAWQRSEVEEIRELATSLLHQAKSQKWLSFIRFG